jgi:hypothetical protein
MASRKKVNDKTCSDHFYFDMIPAQGGTVRLHLPSLRVDHLTNKRPAHPSPGTTIF